eukprot:11261787-Heterocapsa_arctica.AAC.1
MAAWVGTSIGAQLATTLGPGKILGVIATRREIPGVIFQLSPLPSTSRRRYTVLVLGTDGRRSVRPEEANNPN